MPRKSTTGIRGLIQVSAPLKVRCPECGAAKGGRCAVAPGEDSHKKRVDAAPTRYVFRLRWRDAKTGEYRAFKERMPAQVKAAQAKARALELLHSCLSGDFDPNRSASMKLSALFDAYETWLRGNRPGAVKDRAGHRRAFLEITGDIDAETLAPWHLEKFKSAKRAAWLEAHPEERAKVAADRSAALPVNATINRTIATVKHLAKLAARGRLAQRALMSREQAALLREVEKLKELPGRVRYLRPEEAEALDRTLPDWLRPIAAFGLLTGARLGEGCRLTRASVDMDARIVVLTRTKSNRVRRVPITDALVPVLQAALAAQDGPWVFPNPEGEPYRVDSASRAFKRAVDAAGIADLRTHDLRHSFCTAVRRGGAGLDTVQALAGHATPAMTQRYTHDGDARAVAAVQGLTLPFRVGPTMDPGDQVARQRAKKSSAISVGHDGLEPSANGLRGRNRR